jgi:hypothetical protein
MLSVVPQAARVRRRAMLAAVTRPPRRKVMQTATFCGRGTERERRRGMGRMRVLMSKKRVRLAAR